MSLHQEAQEADTLILFFSSGIIDTNSHISMLAWSNKRERKSNANQLLDHRKITAAPNLTILKTEFPKYCFQFQDKEPFPTETYCHLCCALLAWAAARCLVIFLLLAKLLLHGIPCPHTLALPQQGCSGLTHSPPSSKARPHAELIFGLLLWIQWPLLCTCSGDGTELDDSSGRKCQKVKLI